MEPDPHAVPLWFAMILAVCAFGAGIVAGLLIDVSAYLVRRREERHQRRRRG